MPASACGHRALCFSEQYWAESCATAAKCFFQSGSWAWPLLMGYSKSASWCGWFALAL